MSPFRDNILILLRDQLSWFRQGATEYIVISKRRFESTRNLEKKRYL